MHGHPQNQPPYAYPQTVIVQKKGGGCLKALLIGAGVVALLVVVGAIVSGGRDSTGTGETAAAGSSTSGSSASDTKREKAGIGDVVKDGKFSFTVTKIEKGLSEVGEGITRSEAQGQYVLVHLTVKNIGDEGQTFTDMAQKLIDSRKREYDADTGAAIWLKNSNAFLKSINPGNSVKGLVVFDVPKDTKLTAIELHDSIFSDGVTVALG